MFFWRRVAPQIPEEGLKPTATPSYTRNFRDLNNFVSRGKSFSGYERNSLFLNQNGEGFAEVAGLLGVDFDDDARAVASVDWDRDGDLDLWITNRTAPQVRLLKNNQPTKNTFVAIRLFGNGTTTNRDAVGARLTLSNSSSTTPDRGKQIRTVHAGDGFLAQSSSWTHFGLGETTGDLSLSVHWPGGASRTYSGLRAGRRYTIEQGDSKPREETSTAAEVVSTQRAPTSNTSLRPKPASNGFWVANPLPFPELKFKDAQGARRTTLDLRGKPVLVNIWATWCAPCLEELGTLAERTTELQAQNATVLALNVDELAIDGNKAASTKEVEQLLNRIGYELPHGRAEKDNLAKIEILIEFLSSRRSSISIPSSFLLDANGNVNAVYLEPVTWEQLSTDLALLESRPGAQLARAAPRPGRWVADPRRVDQAAYFGDYATLFATNGFPQESQRLYGMIAGQQGGSGARAYYNQAKSAAQQGQTKQAKEYYRAAIRLDPKYGQALTGLGALLLMEKRLTEAKQLFEQALAIDPNHATALVNLAMIDQAQGNANSALDRLQMVVARNPGFAQAQFNLGSLLASMQNHEEAIFHLSKSVELQPKMIPAHINLAIVYAKTTKWGLAEKHFGIAENLNPKNAFVANSLGNVLFRQSRYKEAVAAYRRAIALGYQKTLTFLRLGKSLLELGKKEAAVDAFKSALVIDPTNAEAQKLLMAISAAPLP